MTGYILVFRKEEDLQQQGSFNQMLLNVTILKNTVTKSKFGLDCCLFKWKCFWLIKPKKKKSLFLLLSVLLGKIQNVAFHHRDLKPADMSTHINLNILSS